MIVGHELREWALGREEQRRARQAVDSFGRRWSDGRHHQRFKSSFAACGGDAEALTNAAHDLLADDEWIEELLGNLSGEMLRNPFMTPHFPSITSDIHTGILIFDDEHGAIVAGVAGVAQLAAKKNVAGRTASINFTGQVNVLKVVKSGGARLSFWEAPRLRDDFAGAEAGRCFKTGERRLDDGEIFVVDGRYQSYIIEHATRDLVVLQVVIKCDQAPVSVEYDAVTHEFVGCSATDDGASRIQMITTLLRRMHCEEAFEVIAEFLDDPRFFVRWHVMRELLGLDAVAALPHLCRLASGDPHPDVRRAAGAALARIQLQNPALAEAAACRA
jgi:hypothetical protein